MKQCSKHRMSRRDFLRNAAITAGTAAIGLLTEGCQPQSPAATPTAEPEAKLTPTRAPTATLVPTATSTARSEVKLTSTMAPTTTLAPTATISAAATRPKVAIASVNSYDRKLIQEQVRNLLDSIGGLGDVVRKGDRVAIKTNLTGGVKSGVLKGVAPIDSFITHPEVVRALAGFVRDAGAKEVFIVESVYEWESYTQWGYEEAAKAVDAKLIDLNQTAPYNDYVKISPGANPAIYENFTFNHILEDVDVFMSVSKLKCHYCCGVTHTMKNLVGLVPARFYTLNPGDNYRSGFHGTDEQLPTRLPSIVVDLNRARPIHLGLIDGIKTAEGGEGPWIGTFAAVTANVLLAGKSVLAADAVATAVMGFDPTAEMPDPPFLRAKNHLNIARELGLGTNRLDEIEVVGAQIDDVKTKFEPCWEQ